MDNIYIVKKVDYTCQDGKLGSGCGQWRRGIKKSFFGK